MKPAPPPRILVVDDDRRLAESLVDWLREIGHPAEAAGTIAEARRHLNGGGCDVAMVDLRLREEDGLDLIREIDRKHDDVVTLGVTGFATGETAVETVRAGAFDLLTKPIIDDELSLAIERAIASRDAARENHRLRQQLDRRESPDNILSHDYRMLKLFDVIDSVADARASILITGENGTGKSMIARSIHRRSSRRGGPLVEVACGALPDTLLESELFGHVAGAFTGANGNKIGKFEAADGGTLFLDEIATASTAMQVKLLRVLQELAFEPVGGTETRTVDTRVIFATNEDLSAAVADHRFREDLFYRINVINLVIPPLRERPGDIPLLVHHFVRESAEASDRNVDGFDRAAMDAMAAYRWPGNVRQLENVVERAVLLSSERTMTVDDLPPEILGRSIKTNGAASVADAVRVPTRLDGMTLREALEGPEREIILQSLRRHEWNRVATASALDINRTTLYKKMKRLGLDDPRLQFAEV